MAEKRVRHCDKCAYVKKTDQGMWCPFHDAAVTNTNYCPDFLDEFESPQWKSLARGMTGENNKATSKNIFMGGDITAVVIIIVCILLCLGFCFVGYLAYLQG